MTKKRFNENLRKYAYISNTTNYFKMNVNYWLRPGPKKISKINTSSYQVTEFDKKS